MHLVFLGKSGVTLPVRVTARRPHVTISLLASGWRAADPDQDRRPGLSPAARFPMPYLAIRWRYTHFAAGELQDICRLKLLLDQFSDAIGPRINFDKSTVVPMHMPEHVLPTCLQTLGCHREGFPQTYLGLPLSCSKLNLTAFAPYIAKADRYLTGWQASLLDPMGCVVLVNTVLDG
jgi:hypothetical protein